MSGVPIHLKTKSRPPRKGLALSGAGWVLPIALLVLLVLCLPASAQETALYFKQNCASCHWIGGGRLIGPDLQHVTQRAERDWLIDFINDPKAALDAQDPYAMKLKEEANGAIMINVPGMTRATATDLLDFIESESALDSSRFAGVKVDLAPFTDEDIARGFELFSGTKKLSADGPLCMSCHTSNTIGATLGGQLGPNLTSVFKRLQGRNALSAWLAAPPTETMKSVFGKQKLTEAEIYSLVAYFESTANADSYNFDLSVIWLGVVLCGLGGSIFCMMVFGSVFGTRFKSVRRDLVNTSKNQR